MPLPQTETRLIRSLAREEAYGRIRDWIIDGTLRPGETLRDQEIAQLLGVSRTPVREALRRLEDEGFVETALNRWTRVAPLDLRKAMELYGVLEALEVFALENAQLTPQDLANMAAANDAMQRSIERRKAASALQADETFHGVWMARAQNSELWVLVAQLKTKLRRVELAYWDRAAQTEQSIREHTAILKALKKGLRREAITALKQNWEGSMRRLRTVAESQDSDKS
ncbi:MAG TPA: GntR family transcriptional regulator [Terriglobales bacterium]|jgi:DNA-binding GntR family transcriptional regulator|nr:GntR family transcriptional regulator [Terriglobales bacterium]